MPLGIHQSVWLKQSTTYGTAETMSAGTLAGFAVRPNVSLRKVVNRIKTEHLRGTAGMKVAEDLLGLVSAEGGFGGVVPWGGANVTWLLKNATGKVTTTGAGPYTHLFNWSDFLFPGFSVAVNRGAKTDVFDGCQVASLTFRFAVGAAVEWQVELIGKDERAITFVNPPTIAGTGLADPYWITHQITAELDDVAVSITGCEITLTNELEAGEDKSYYLGSNVRNNLTRSAYGVTGTIRRRWLLDGSGQTSKFYDRFIAGTASKLEVFVTHPTDVANYGCTFQFHQIKAEGQSTMAGDRAHIMEEIPFTAYDLDSASSFVSIKDIVAEPATATGAYNP